MAAKTKAKVVVKAEWATIAKVMASPADTNNTNKEVVADKAAKVEVKAVEANRIPRSALTIHRRINKTNQINSNSSSSSLQDRSSRRINTDKVDRRSRIEYFQIN